MADMWSSSRITVADIPSEIDCGLHLVDTRVAENVHHPAPQLDVEKNDHAVGGLH